jgi:hypothetical protein
VLGSDPGVGAVSEISRSIERIDRRSCHCRLMLGGDGLLKKVCGTRKEEPAQGMDLRRKSSTLATGRGGRKIVSAVWTLHPSPELVEENIRSNEQMAEKNEEGAGRF